MNTNDTNWQEIGRKLCEPFNPDNVDFRPQGKVSSRNTIQAICYVDARTVAARLDEAVGPENWTFRFEPLVTERGEIQIAKGILTIHGVTKEDVGDGSNFATSKGCVSDALKRAAVLWGIGRYLYEVENTWVPCDKDGRITEDAIKRMRGKLPRPQGKAPAQPTAPAPAQDAPPADTLTEPMASPEQIRMLRKAGELLDREVPATGTLTATDAEALLAKWREEWKRKKQLNPPPIATPDLSALPMAQEGVRP